MLIILLLILKMTYSCNIKIGLLTQNTMLNTNKMALNIPIFTSWCRSFVAIFA